MPEKVTCEECGEQFDPRGIAAHKRMKHGGSEPVAATDGGTEVSDGGALSVQKDDLDVPDEEIDAALPAANVTEDAITFRSIHEIEVTDEEMKRELLAELKEFIRGGSLRM